MLKPRKYCGTISTVTFRGDFMKRIFSVTVSALLLLAFAVSAFSTDIDGFDKGAEWDGATTYKLIDGESNCNVNFAAVKVKLDAENSAVFMCFMFIDPNLDAENAEVGVSLAVENSTPFVITASSTPAGYDIGKYSFDSAISVDKNSGATCEMRIGFKEGLPKTIGCTVRFIDACGEPSNYYDFVIVNEFFVETTAMVLKPTRDNSDPAYNPDFRTTKAKTTKKTTSRKTTTQKTVIKTSPPYSYTGRTKRETTKRAKQTEAVKTEAVKTVYYVEKEVVIIMTAAQTDAVTQPATTQHLTAVNTEITQTVQELQTQKTVSLSQGQKYQKIITAVGGVMFLLIACFGVYSTKRKNNTNG